MASSTKKSAHILVFPFPAQGHTIPLLDLTHQLSLRGLTITLLTTPRNLPTLSPFLSSNPTIQTLVLPFPPHPSLPPGLENVRDIGNHGNIPVMSALSHLQDPIIRWFASHHNPPVVLLSDFFLGWTRGLAERIGIPRICFYSAGPFLAAVFDSLWSSPPEAVDRERGGIIRFGDLPRTPGFSWEQLPSLYRRYRELQERDPSYELMSTLVGDNSLSWADVFNSFHELESEFLEFWIQKMGHSRAYIVGPLNLTGNSKSRAGGCEDNVVSWLDQWADDDGCVLYVCFGSQKLLKRAQMEALAAGLERSGVRFVWAVKVPTAEQEAEGYGSVPDGFEGQVTGRGMVVKGWAPQRAILSHRAVGWFLSHCGWNSMLEAISEGVTILGWPMEADQFVNAKLLVEYKGAAVVVCQGGDTIPDSAELAQKIGESMRGNAVERVRTKELRSEALEAIKVDGTSYNHLDRLVQEIHNLK